MRPSDLLGPGGAERQYWENQTFTARHPRWTGAFAVVVGALALAPALLDRAEGHRHTGGRGAVLGGVAVMAGLWLLVTGYPREADGRAPSWWGVSLAALSAFGAVVGVALW